MEIGTMNLPFLFLDALSLNCQATLMLMNVVAAGNFCSLLPYDFFL